MDISNSLTTGLQTAVVPFKNVPPVNQPEKEARSESRNTNNQDSPKINPVEFIKKGEALQSERYLRETALENAPLKGQQAVSSYQQTIDAARQYEEGELVGIDLYI